MMPAMIIPPHMKPPQHTQKSLLTAVHVVFMNEGGGHLRAAW